MELQEKFLHHIWDQRHLKPDLKTVSGKAVKVIYQGQYNTADGPDFKNVVLNIDGDTINGDVEIHLNTYDWKAHEHYENPAYNNMILHVVLEHKGSQQLTITESAKEVEILELKDQIDADIAKLFSEFQDQTVVRHVGICDFFKLNTSEQLEVLLRKHGLERFERKCQRYNAELHFDGFDQLLYNGFMEAMGYDKNKFNTLTLAHHFKWNTLQEWAQRGLDNLSLTAVWLNYANLMEKAAKLLPEDNFQQIRTAFERQSFTTDKGAINWNLFRVRPPNHPVKRILQAGQVISNILKKGFLNTLIPIFEDYDANDIRKLCSASRNALHDKTNQSLAVKDIAQTMLQTIIANIFLPIMHLYAEKTHNKQLQVKIMQMYQVFPPLSSNHVTNFMQGYVSAGQWKLINRKYINQQGLMNIYYRFCNFRLCDLCGKDKDIKLLEL